MDYIHYQQKYEKEVVDLWNRCLFKDSINAEKFRKMTILDENFDDNLSWIAINDKKVIGFSYGTKRKFPYMEKGLEPERGWINVLFVDPQFHKMGIGTQLFNRVENALIKLGVKNITLCAYSPNYYFWGIDKDSYKPAICFFEKFGYKFHSEHYSMYKNLFGYQIPKEILDKKNFAEKKGYKFVSFSYDYTLDLLKFVQKEFGGGWKRNALLAMQNNIAEDVITLLLDKNDNICGCCNRAIDGNLLRIGPFGIAKDKRNEGLGSVLFCVSLYEMSKKGLYYVFFGTTNEGGRRFYERLGFKLNRVLWEYRKLL